MRDNMIQIGFDRSCFLATAVATAMSSMVMRSESRASVMARTADSWFQFETVSITPYGESFLMGRASHKEVISK